MAGCGWEKLQSSHRQRCWLKNMFNSTSPFVKTHLVAGEKPECKCQQWESTVTTSQDLQHPLLELLQSKTEAWSQVNIPPHKRLSQASGRGKTGPAGPAYLQPPPPSSTSPKSSAPQLSAANPWLIWPKSSFTNVWDFTQFDSESGLSGLVPGEKSVNLLTVECRRTQRWVGVKPEHLLGTLTCCRTLSRGSALTTSSTVSPVSSLLWSVNSKVSGLTRHFWSFPTCEGSSGFHGLQRGNRWQITAQH